MELNKLMLPLLSGAVTGYITNNYAVKMLFKKYGPFGGMILSTRQEFTTQISELVERDIINKQTLENELERYEFRKSFYNLINGVLKKHIYVNTPNIKFKEIPEFQLARENVQKFCGVQLSNVARDLAQALLEKIAVEEFIGEQQQEFLMGKLQEILVKELQDDNVLATIIQGCYLEHQDKMLQEFIEPEFFTRLAGNLQTLTSDFHEKLQKELASEVTQSIAEVYKNLDGKQLINNFLRSIEDKSFQDILGSTSCDQIAENLQAEINKKWNTTIGENLSLELSQQLLLALQDVERPILSIFTADVQEKITAYLQANLPIIIEEIIKWLKCNNMELENLLNQSIDEVLTTSSGDFLNWRSKIKKILKENFTDNLAKRYDMLEYLVKYIRENTDYKTVSQKLSQELLEYISKKNISQVIKDLQTYKILQGEQISSLVQKTIGQYLVTGEKTLFSSLFGKKIGAIVPLDLSIASEKYLSQALVKYVQEAYLFTPKSTEFLQKQIATRFSQLPQTKIKQVAKEETIVKWGELAQKELLRKNSRYQLQVKKKLNKLAKQEFEAAKLINLLPTSRLADARSRFEEWLIIFLNRELDKLQEHDLKKLYDKLNNHKDNVKNFTGFALDISKKNLQEILAGKIKIAVANNLSKMSDSAIQELVENFMGKELKPINLFGAILGAATGIGTFLLEQSFLIKFNYVGTLVYAALVYGLVGYLTNIIALKMIFQPYVEKKIWGLVLPFTPGVVSKQQPRFAKSMADFVGENLLTATSVQELFQANRKLLAENIKRHIAAENYLVLENILKEQNELLARQGWQRLYKYGQENYSFLSSRGHQYLGKCYWQDFRFLNLPTDLDSKVRGYLGSSVKELSREFVLQRQSTAKLGDLVSPIIKVSSLEMISDIVEAEIKDARKLVSGLTLGPKMEAKWTASYQNQLQRNFGELLGGDKCQQIKTIVVSWVLKQVQTEKLIKFLPVDLKTSIDSALNSAATIEELFSGGLLNTLQENSAVILQNILTSLQLELQSQNQQIKQTVYENFRQSSGVVLKGADLILDIEGDIYAIIDKFLYTKLPEFVQSKEHELQRILQEFLWNKIAVTPIKTLGIGLDGQGIRELGLELLHKPQIQQGLELLINKLIDMVMEIPGEKIVAGTKLSEFTGVYKLFAQESEQLRHDFVAQLVAKREAVTAVINSLISSILQKTLWQFPINKLMQGISAEFLERNIVAVVDAVWKSEVVKSQYEEQSRKIANVLQNTALDKFVDLNLMQKDLEKLLLKIAKDENLTMQVEKILHDQILILADALNSLIPKASKDFVLNIVVDSLLDGLAEQLLKILEAVDIQAVTEREISAMEPQAIEEMFNSFAQPYFSKIATYGWLGGGIGVLAKIIEKIALQIKI